LTESPNILKVGIMGLSFPYDGGRFKLLPLAVWRPILKLLSLTAKLGFFSFPCL
jgi:hypothetical protein